MNDEYLSGTPDSNDNQSEQKRTGRFGRRLRGVTAATAIAAAGALGTQDKLPVASEVVNGLERIPAMVESAEYHVGRVALVAQVEAVNMLGGDVDRQRQLRLYDELQRNDTGRGGVVTLEEIGEIVDDLRGEDHGGVGSLHPVFDLSPQGGVPINPTPDS